MERDDVVKLLQLIAVYDGRKIDTLVVRVWTESAARGRWTLDEAVDAVHQHNAMSTDWLKPGHITGAIHAKRRLPAPAAEVLALAGASPASPERRAEVMAMVRAIADAKAVAPLTDSKDVVPDA